MVLTASQMLPLATPLPAFALQQVWGPDGPLGSANGPCWCCFCVPTAPL